MSGVEGFAMPTSCQYLSQHIGTCTCCHQFVARHLVGRTHCAADEVRFAAVARSVALFDAAYQGMPLRRCPSSTWKCTLIERRLPVESLTPSPKGEGRSMLCGHILCLKVFTPLSLRGGVGGEASQHLVHRQRVHNLVHVEESVRIPAAFQLAHQLEGLLAVE